uniref:Uncharacterized protein LOC102806000 n=1 Tax=Saccoglossus kowalevskii TaxID=10224 RepID=A0ABM0M547_SACKO|nr:PREDICTED: uncharacterized protein LOC102806000 [Saccoglossus kowalevskii]
MGTLNTTVSRLLVSLLFVSTVFYCAIYIAGFDSLRVNYNSLYAASTIHNTPPQELGESELTTVTVHGGISVGYIPKHKNSTKDVSSEATVFNASLARVVHNITTISYHRNEQIVDHLHRSQAKKKYILPIHHFGSGPNFNYLHFRMTLLFALYTNRTAVESWFYIHFSQKRSLGWKFLNETFDIDKIRNLIDVAYIDEFKRECNSTVDMVIMWPSDRGDRVFWFNKYRELFQKLHQIYLPVLTDAIVTSDISEMLRRIRNVRCVAMYKPLEFSKLTFPQKDELLRNIDVHLDRPIQVQHLADLLSQTVCGDRPYLALHFRTKEEEWCKYKIEKCNPQKVLATNESAERIAEDIVKLMAIRNIPCMYIALPSYAKITVSYHRNKHDMNHVHINQMKKKYILPIHHFVSGPNFHYLHFRMALLFALYTNRTVVESWFLIHFSQKKSLGWRFLNETFDIDSLRNLLDVAYIDEFKRECNNTVDMVIMWPSDRPNLELNYNKYEQLFADLHQINLPVLSKAVISSNISHIMTRLKNVHCAAMYYPWDFAKFTFPQKDNLLRKIDIHLSRTISMQHMADLVTKIICDGRPYLALHFRAKAEEWCKYNMVECDPEKIMGTEESAERVSEDIVNLMETRNISCMYIALPPFARKYKYVFQKRIPNIFTREDVRKNSPLLVTDAMRDNYNISLLEQELCIRKLFLFYLCACVKMFAMLCDGRS